MRDDLYFDKVHGRPLRASDGGAWRDRGGDKDVPFWLHSSGVPVFLSAEEIAANQYAEGDPLRSGGRLRRSLPGPLRGT